MAVGAFLGFMTGVWAATEIGVPIDVEVTGSPTATILGAGVVGALVGAGIGALFPVTRTRQLHSDPGESAR
jgi:hypothetical protein